MRTFARRLAATAAVLVLTTGAAGTSATATSRAVYWGEAPQSPPNYIFPFMSGAFYRIANGPQFQQLMYRPLYWFGNGSDPTLDSKLSLAANPVYSQQNTEVTIDLKQYRWSDGESVTARQVMFWLNLTKVEYLNWAAYVPGGIPDDVASVTAPNSTTVVIALRTQVNPSWFTYDELSQITPFPMAWDVSRVGERAEGDACGRASYASVVTKATRTTVTPVSAAARSCAAVWAYLSRQSGFDPSNPKAPNTALASYATNPLWQVVDGPWKLAAFDPSGKAVFRPNQRYSGPVKPRVSEFVELPFASDAAELNALAARQLTVGTIQVADVPQPGTNNPRLAATFTTQPWYAWSINYAPYNFHSVGDGGEAGKVFRQLYFRQAMQLLVDQPDEIARIYKGYAAPVYGPVPVLPKNSFATSTEAANPYRYDPGRATALLASHGWKVVPDGVTTCAQAKKCGVPAGTELRFALQFVAGNPAEQQLMQAERAAWGRAGIQVTLTAGSFQTVIRSAFPCSGSRCAWELENWGGGFVYSPDYYPSGELLFQSGTGSNTGSYSNATADRLIKQTTFGGTDLTAYENFVSRNLPVVWQPNPAYGLTEVQNGFRGVFPQNPLLAINPESWYFAS